MGGSGDAQDELGIEPLDRMRLHRSDRIWLEGARAGWRNSCHRAQFRSLAQDYKNNLSRAFLGPILLILLVLVLFIAYVAQDQMKIAFSMLGTVGAGAATLTALGNKLRSLRSLTTE